jgi:hypothetical protein
VLATIALRHTAGQVSHGVAQATAATNGYVLAFRIGAIVTAVGGVLVLTLFEKVRPTQDDGEAVEVGPSPANADAGHVQPA